LTRDLAPFRDRFTFGCGAVTLDRMSHDNDQKNAVFGGASPAAREDNPEPVVTRLWRFTRMFPWTILLILAAVTIELLPAEMRGRGSVLDYVMITASIVVLVLEIAKSADIKMTRFVADIVSAVAGVAIASSLLTYYIATAGASPSFYHWMVTGVLVTDAILSPIISFATALRNMAVGDA